jgi:hypothetical protein
VRTELIAATKALLREVETGRLPVSGRALASAATSMAHRTTTQTDSAPRRIRSVVF